MSDQPIRDNSGALFRIPAKERLNERWPDLRGDITINGQKYWLSAWIKEGKRGKFMSLAVKPAEEKREEQPVPQTPSRGGNAYAAARGLDDEIPF